VWVWVWVCVCVCVWVGGWVGGWVGVEGGGGVQPASRSTLAAGVAACRVDFEDLTFHELIGKGSCKTVYRGRWNSTMVAIVCMRRGGAVKEARFLQQLSNHPNLVQFYRCVLFRAFVCVCMCVCVYVCVCVSVFLLRIFGCVAF